jgi:transcriptional regulator with XRE-family HTH domain
MQMRCKAYLRKGGNAMAGEFGAFIAQKRLEKDVKLRPIAEKLGVSVTYLSDIIKGRRNPPDIDGLEALAKVLNLNEGEREEMFDLAGRERNQVSPDLPEYIMDAALPNARVALRRAKNQGLGDDFWQEVNQIIDKRNGGE